MKGDNELNFFVKGDGYLYMSYYAPDGRVEMSAALRVNKVDFDAGKVSKPHRSKMDRLRQVISNHESTCMLGGHPVRKMDVHALLLEALGKKARRPAGTLGELFRLYRDQVKEGKILKDGKRFSESWMTLAKSVEVLLGPLAAVTASDIREGDINGFIARLTDAKYARNTVTTYQSILIGMLNASRRMGWHKAPELDPKAYRVGWENIDHKVYVRKPELKAMLALPYEGKKARLRDVFVLGCRLGLRHSDLLRITPEHRIGDSVNINTEKTGTPVWVPLVPMAKAIWDQYGGVFEVPNDERFRRFIRRLGEAAGLDKQVLFRRTEGGKKVEEWQKTYELMGTHTMRRSFATNAYLDGVPMPSIMKVTGHKSVATFLKYVCLTDEEHAGVLATNAKFAADD